MNRSSEIVRRSLTLAATTVLVAGPLTACSQTVPGSPSTQREGQVTASSAAPTTPSVVAGQADQMAKIRQTDACALYDRELAEQLGSFQHFDRKGSWTGCSMFIADSENPGQFFRFDLDLDLKGSPNSQDIAEKIGGQTVYRDFLSKDDKPDAYSCDYRIPAGTAGGSYAFGVAHLAPPKNKPIPWAKPCEYARGYLEKMMPVLQSLPAHPIDGAGTGSLIQKNPCLNEQQMLAAFPGWRTQSLTWTKAYWCKYTLEHDGDQHTAEVELSFERNNEQKPVGQIRLPSGGLDGQALIQTDDYTSKQGLNGVEIRSALSGNPGHSVDCHDALTYRRADPPGSGTAHLINASVSITSKTAPFPFDACQQLNQLLPTVVQNAG